MGARGRHDGGGDAIGRHVTRVLFVGYMGRGQTSGMRCAALQRLGYDVASVDAGTLWQGAGYLERQLESRLNHSARVQRFNDSVIAAAVAHTPRVVWAEKQEYLYPETLSRLRELGALTIHYNPDPYFSLAWKRTPLADACLRMYDVMVVTKRYELDLYREHASGLIIYSPLGYDPVGHAPPSSAERRDDQKVVFVGGWEPRRERLLETARTATAGVAVWGYGWRIAQRSRLDPLRAMRLGRLDPEHRFYLGKPREALRTAIRDGEGKSGEIFEERYSAVIAGSAIALGFVRKVCPDQHTTRTFEIPAIGGFMLADRTDEHLEFFEEGKEAEFFGSDDEYEEKIQYYLHHEDARARIASAGRRRCLTSGYAYDDRIRAVMSALALRSSDS
jgi:spore maturation protein CgeB